MPPAWIPSRSQATNTPSCSAHSPAKTSSWPSCRLEPPLPQRPDHPRHHYRHHHRRHRRRLTSGIREESSPSSKSSDRQHLPEPRFRRPELPRGPQGAQAEADPPRIRRLYPRFHPRRRGRLRPALHQRPDRRTHHRPCARLRNRQHLHRRLCRQCLRTSAPRTPPGPGLQPGRRRKSRSRLRHRPRTRRGPLPRRPRPHRVIMSLNTEYTFWASLRPQEADFGSNAQVRRSSSAQPPG